MLFHPRQSRNNLFETEALLFIAIFTISATANMSPSSTETISLIFTAVFGVLSLLVALLNLWVAHKTRVERLVKFDRAEDPERPYRFSHHPQIELPMSGQPCTLPFILTSSPLLT